MRWRARWGAGSEVGQPEMKGRPEGRPKWGLDTAPEARGWLAPIAAATATRPAAVIPAGAGVVHAEVGATHVAIAEARVARLGGGYDTAAAAAAAVQEMMGEFFAGNHACAHGQS